jgi:multicomponent Na+:H+ antiporter subunit D
MFSEFGAGGAFAQIGLEVVPRELDALNRVFGIGFLIVTVLLALYSSARRNRFEDAAILLMAGSAVSALFVGDFLSLAAALSLSGLAGAWVVLASGSPGSPAAGVRLLIWHGLEGLLLLFGLAFHLSTGAADSNLHRLNAHEIDGAFFFAALMIRVGAPGAHVWLKDAAAHASGPGGVALALFPAVLGVYALARLFPAEPLLVPIGAAMIVVGAFFALAEDDLRRAAAYAQIAQLGVCVSLIGIGSPLAIAAAAAHAFTIVLAFALMQMALGGIVARLGAARLSALEGLGRAMPVTCVIIVLAGLAAAGAPFLAVYASFAVALETTAQWEHRAIWVVFTAMPAALLIALTLRPALVLFRSAPKRRAFLEAPFPMLLAAALAAFFCIAIGMSPSWLYRLTPQTALAFEPYLPERLGPQLALLGAAGAAYLALHALKWAPKHEPGAAPRKLLDLDALYRGPMVGAGRWFGIVLLRLHGAWRAGAHAFSIAMVRRVSDWSRACDRPYGDQLSGWGQLAVICVVLSIILLAGHF